MSENKHHQSNTDANISKIITSLQHGDNSGFETIFNLYYSDVYNIAMRNVNDSDAAGDITQETFIEIFETISSLREPNAFKAWVKKIAYHRCTNYFRIKAHRHEAVIDEEEYEAFVNNIEEDRAVFSPEGSLDQSALREILMNIIFSLPPEQRETVLMYYYEDMTVAEIADIQAAPADTVKSRLYYGRKALKKGIENYEKKSAITLHGLSVIPLFRWALESESFAPSVESVASIAEGIASATGVSVTAGKGILIQGENIMSKFITSIKAFVSANKVATIVTAASIAVVGGGVGVGIAVANTNEPGTYPDKTNEAIVEQQTTGDEAVGTESRTEIDTTIDSTMIDTETEKETEAETEKATEKETEAETIAPDETDAPETDAPATQAPETTPAADTKEPAVSTSAPGWLGAPDKSGETTPPEPEPLETSKPHQDPDTSLLTGTQDDVGKVVGFDSIINQDIKVVKVLEETSGLGQRVITTFYSNGRSSSVIECLYCHEFPCPDGGNENCLEYDIKKDYSKTCIQCGKPRGNGYDGTCSPEIDWDSGKTICHNYD